jgi:hypothetical protein
MTCWAIRHPLVTDELLLEPVIAEIVSQRQILEVPLAYLASWDMFMRIDLMPFGTTPRPQDLKPSSLVIR